MALSPSQDEALTIPVHLEKSDIYSAVLINSMRSPLNWLTPLWVAALVYHLVSDYKYGWIVAFVMSLFSFFIILFSVARASLRMQGVLTPITYTLSGDGITAQFENGKNSADWSLVKGASETSKYIFVKMQRGSFHLVPKRQITEDQAVRLRQILRRHSPVKVRLQTDPQP